MSEPVEQKDEHEHEHQDEVEDEVTDEVEDEVEDEGEVTDEVEPVVKKSSYKGKYNKAWSASENDALFQHIKEWKDSPEGDMNATRNTIAKLMATKMQADGYNRSWLAISHRIQEHNEDGERTMDIDHYRKKQKAGQGKLGSSEVAEQPSKKEGTANSEVSSAPKGLARQDWKKKCTMLEKKIAAQTQEIEELKELLALRTKENKSYRRIVHKDDRRNIRRLEGQPEESDEEEFEEDIKESEEEDIKQEIEEQRSLW